MSAPRVFHPDVQAPTSSTRLAVGLFGGLIALSLLAASWPASAAKPPPT